ncbi:MAG: SpoIID/LytB domain-containing protein [Nitrospiraceae bacterium]|nr:MAG: SpoIID/LytB domain-containing protein [Nitrospiraceae bacterium]
MSERRLAAIGWFLLLPLLTPSLANADTTIRVAIVQNAESVALSAPSGLIVKAPNDNVVANGRITVAAGASGLVVDGQRLRSDRIEIRGRNGDITVNNLTVAGRVTIKRQNGKLIAINEVALEDYVKGVVPSEMNANWHPEALKAQAMAARTYALYKIRQNGKKDFDVVASTKDQVYKGRAGADGPAGRATDETRGQVLVFQDEPILAAFFSTAAGPTEDALNVWSVDLPYLKGVECPFDMNSPYFQWRTDVWLPLLEQRLREEGFPVGVIAGLSPAAYTKAGRVSHVRILHSDGELHVKGEDLRRVLGYTVLASTQFDFEVVGFQVQFTGRGAGHGVGLCQWGAKELAEKGYSAEAIVRYYYPGTEIRDISSLPRR